MNLSHKNKWIFFANPKCASSSVASNLENYEDCDLDNSGGGINHRNYINTKTWLNSAGYDIDEYFKFSFVRNPFEKILSFYKWILRAVYVTEKIQRVSANERAALKNLINSVTKSHIEFSFKVFCKNIDAFAWKGLTFNHMFCENGENKMDFIGKVENLQEDFNIVCDKIGIPRQELPHINKTEHKHYTEYYDDETRQIVAEKYKKDIEYFGYEFKKPVKKLICLYTCLRDRRNLEEFKKTSLYARILNDASSEVIEVYADAPTTNYSDGKLYLSCEESYDKLSSKTYEMIKYCVSNFEFDQLVKIDPSIVAQSKGVGGGHSAETLSFFYDLNRIENMVFSDDYMTNRGGYGGAMLQGGENSRGYTGWAQMKGVDVNYDAEFSADSPTPFIYTGKFYFVNNEFCNYIAEHGEKTAYRYVENLGGSEDMFVGKMFADHKKDQAWIYQNEHWYSDFSQFARKCYGIDDIKPLDMDHIYQSNPKYNVRFTGKTKLRYELDREWELYDIWKYDYENFVIPNAFDEEEELGKFKNESFRRKAYLDKIESWFSAENTTLNEPDSAVNEQTDISSDWKCVRKNIRDYSNPLSFEGSLDYIMCAMSSNSNRPTSVDKIKHPLVRINSRGCRNNRLYAHVDYLQFIVENYHKLPRTILFASEFAFEALSGLHGHHPQHETREKLLSEINNTETAFESISFGPTMRLANSTELESWCDEFGITYPKKAFPTSSVYAVNRLSILRNSLHWYVKLLNWAHDNLDKLEYIEKSWLSIIGNGVTLVSAKTSESIKVEPLEMQKSHVKVEVKESIQNIEAVTVCVNYADSLEKILANRRHFDKWVIVTTNYDLETRNLCTNHNLECIVSDRIHEPGIYQYVDKRLNTEFGLEESEKVFMEKAPLAKGKAINDGFAVCEKNDWLVHIDADILLPDNFRETLNEMSLNKAHLYGLSGRTDEGGKTQGNWINGMGKGDHGAMGWFQMFHSTEFEERFDGKYFELNADTYWDDWRFAKKFGKNQGCINLDALNLRPISHINQISNWYLNVKKTKLD
jgi:chondroitin 4-sulfotransferase 11